MDSISQGVGAAASTAAIEASAPEEPFPVIRPYRGKLPEIAASAYIDPASVLIGDVVIGADSSVWPCTVIRGDVNYIRIGARTNIQDASVLHVMRDEYPLILGDDVTVGHSVTLHGCAIDPGCLM